MMNMNKPCADLTVCFLKAKAADDTGRPELCNTHGPCAWVPLVSLNQNGLHSTLDIGFSRFDLLRKPDTL
jgi:hypothetical protein